LQGKPRDQASVAVPGGDSGALGPDDDLEVAVAVDVSDSR
jgi:hypothetical protein